MIEIQSFGLFLAACFALLVVPGPAVLYIVARSVDQGRTAGLVSTLGIALGSMVHVAAAALGISALIMASATAFSVLKYVGAAYLIYLGVRRLLEREVPEPAQPARGSHRRIFWEGAVVNALNPKTALFFVAFIPQFVDVARGSVTLQILILGMTFVVMGVFSDGLYALAAGSAGRWIRGKQSLLRGQRYLTGSVYIGLGLLTAVSGNRNK